MTKDYIRRIGRRVTLTFPDGIETNDLCVIQPLRYKNKMYMEGVGTDLGREKDSYFLMFAPPGFLPPGDLAGHVLADEHYTSWSFVRRDTVLLGDEPAYDWVVLLERTGGPYITVQPVSTMGAFGGETSFSVAVDDENAVCKWQKSTDNGLTWTDAGGAGEDTAELTVSVTEEVAHQLFRCMVTNEAGTVFSNCVRIIYVTGPPEITAQPQNVISDTGENAVFTVAAEMAVSYKWQTSADCGGTWTDTEETGEALTVGAGAESAAVLYRCAVTNPAGTSYSDAVMLTLADAAPVIMVQPADQEAALSETAEFSVTANGATSYQWKSASSATAATWRNVTGAGATTPTLSVKATSASLRQYYRCAVTNANGSTLTDAVHIIQQV